MAKRTDLRDLYAKLQDHNIKLIIMQAFLKLVCMMKKCCKLIKYSLFKKATLVSNTIHFYREDGTEITSVDLSSIAVSDKYLSNILLSGNTYTFKLNNGTTVGQITIPELPEIPEEVYIQSVNLDGTTLKLNYNVDIPSLTVDLKKFVLDMPVIPGYYFSSSILTNNMTHEQFNKLEFIGPDLLRHPDNDTNHRYIYLINSLADVRKIEEYRIMVKDHIYFVVSEIGSGVPNNASSVEGFEPSNAVNFVLPYGEVSYFKYGKINPTDDSPQVYLQKTGTVNLKQVLNLYGEFRYGDSLDLLKYIDAFTVKDPLIIEEEEGAQLDSERPQIGKYYNINPMFTRDVYNLSSRGHNATITRRGMCSNIDDDALNQIYKVFNGVSKVKVIDPQGNNCGEIKSINTRYNYIFAIPCELFTKSSSEIDIESLNPDPSLPNVAYILNQYTLKDFGESSEIYNADRVPVARVYLDVIDQDTNGELFFPNMFLNRDTNTYINSMSIFANNQQFTIEQTTNVWQLDENQAITKIESKEDPNDKLFVGLIWPWEQMSTYKENSFSALGRTLEYILAYCFSSTTCLSGTRKSIYEVDYSIDCGWTNKWKHYTFDFKDCDMRIYMNVLDLYYDSNGEYQMDAVLDIVFNNTTDSYLTDVDKREALRIRCKIGSYVRKAENQSHKVFLAYSTSATKTITGIGRFLPQVTIEKVLALRTYLTSSTSDNITTYTVNQSYTNEEVV